MTLTVTTSREEYEELKRKAMELDKITDEEGLTEEDIKRLEDARKGEFVSKEEFLRRHKNLSE